MKGFTQDPIISDGASASNKRMTLPQIVNCFFVSHPDDWFSARQIAEWVVENRPDWCQKKVNHSPSLQADPNPPKRLIKQLASEMSRPIQKIGVESRKFEGKKQFRMSSNGSSRYESDSSKALTGSSARSKEGIVYLLTNSAMPNLIKIGRTSREDVRSRMRDLFTTSVPLPFECVKAVVVDDASEVENALHKAFAPQRVHTSREFFEIEISQVECLLDAFGSRDVTPEVSEEVKTSLDESDLDAIKKQISRRRPLNFHEMGIPNGSVLHSIHCIETAVVVSEKKVRFRKEEHSLTRATQLVLDLEYAPAPCPNWRFEGRLLQDIYDHYYPL